ncbi:MAG: DUF5107 domain-containing protein [Verrucomicrobia bacterium]|nr:DUF5107 domain-containing protein [Verrucomicrobiota bacterium]
MNSPHPVNRSARRAVLALAVLASSCVVFSAVAAVKASRGELTLPTYPWAAVKHPYFRGTDKVNIYPYPMLDFLSRDKTNRTYRTVVLENEYLRITFLPELGGKIHEVIDKTTGQPMFYVNHVIKPGLIGQCGAWTSGGVEWNTGPQGHTVGCMQSVACEILPPEKDGSRSVAVGETERIYGTKWTVVVTLRPGRSFIEERIRIYNPTEYVRPYYFWNCTAVPNTPGFRFIYPMTLGTDHGSEKFFQWPIHEGKDLSRGTNYHDASSIFAWHCDQDFFGSYDDGADRGVVSYANHHQVPGKKAWTWGQGGFGKMHQMDLTDSDGPYNEVQTGPLLTQGEVGRLDPCEAVEWKEWWYPIHGVGGFTFANRDVAVNAAVTNGQLQLRLLGSGTWSPVRVRVLKEDRVVARAECKLSPATPAELKLPLAGATEPLLIQLVAGQQTLASFRVPLDLPKREPPSSKPRASTATELAETGWQKLLFAKIPEAEEQFRQALAHDSNSVPAHTGLALLKLDPDPAVTVRHARAALVSGPDAGLARLALASAEARMDDKTDALDDAWKASLHPGTAVAGRALAAKLLLQQQAWDRVAVALDGPGPWETDLNCRGLGALALLLRAVGTESPADEKLATRLARANLDADPLDLSSRGVLWLANAEDKSLRLRDLIGGDARSVLDLAAAFVSAGQEKFAQRVMDDLYLRSVPAKAQEPLPIYWSAFLAARAGQDQMAEQRLSAARASTGDGAAPCSVESVAVLRWALEKHPADGQAALLLGHVLFHLGRHAEGREMWKKAAELGAEPVIAYRALGMAAKTLDNDLKSAREWLEKASQADPKDAIVARDLANVLFALADKADSDAEKRAPATAARDRLKAAFAEGKGRSDFVALLARAQNRLGEFAATARMLDSVRVTVWEGSHEVHDLFEAAHLALGEAHLKAGRATEALAEFIRALEYPENLATGKLENAREAHIHYLRGNALAVLGRTQEAVSAWRTAAEEPSSKDEKKEEARRKAKEALERNAKQ